MDPRSTNRARLRSRSRPVVARAAKRWWLRNAVQPATGPPTHRGPCPDQCAPDTAKAGTSGISLAGRLDSIEARGRSTEGTRLRACSGMLETSEAKKAARPQPLSCPVVSTLRPGTPCNVRYSQRLAPRPAMLQPIEHF